MRRKIRRLRVPWSIFAPVCNSPEEFKAWSQDLAHEQVLTTLMSYGKVATDRQGEIIRGLGAIRQSKQPDAEKIAEAVVRKWQWAFHQHCKAPLLCRRAAKGQQLAAPLRLLQIVGPVLHHSGARLQVESMVVGGADCVARRVGKLQLDVIVVTGSRTYVERISADHRHCFQERFQEETSVDRKVHATAGRRPALQFHAFAGRQRRWGTDKKQIL